MDVQGYSNTFGERAGLVFEIVGGPHAGVALMEGATLKDSPHGKLATLLRGLGGVEASLPAARKLIGPPFTKGPTVPKSTASRQLDAQVSR